MVNNRSLHALLFYIISLVSILIPAFSYAAVTNLQLSKKDNGLYATYYKDNVPLNVTVDVYSTQSKANIIKVAKSRIYADTGFSNLGVTSIEQLLTSLNYAIDRTTKEIYKKPAVIDCKNFNSKWRSGTNLYDCPDQAANAAIGVRCVAPNYGNCWIQEMRQNTEFGVLISELPNTTTVTKIYVKWTAKYAPTNSDITLSDTIYAETLTNQRQLLSDEELYKLLVGTSTLLSPQQAGIWTSILDIYKAPNAFEENNNAAYLQLMQLINAKDADGTPSIIPDGNGGSSLPAFCKYATVVCDLVTWLKEPFTDSTDNKVDIQETSEHANSAGIEVEQYFEFDKQCPPNYTKTVNIMGNNWVYDFSFQPLCTALINLSSMLIAASYLLAGMIVAGVRK